MCVCVLFFVCLFVLVFSPHKKAQMNKQAKLEVSLVEDTEEEVVLATPPPNSAFCLVFKVPRSFLTKMISGWKILFSRRIEG